MNRLLSDPYFGFFLLGGAVILACLVALVRAPRAERRRREEQRQAFTAKLRARMNE